MFTAAKAVFILKEILINGIAVGACQNLALIAGPCVIESREHCLQLAKSLKEIAIKLDIPFIFKASYDKANRTSIESYRGPGIEEGLEILDEVKYKINVPVLSDVHSAEEALVAAKVLDVIQIPAFLCRQTDLLVAVGKSGKPVNVKKGQFLAPWDMKHAISKIESTGNKKILLTERGVSLGYNYLVSDMRSLVVMRSFGYPVIFDATHSVQMPGGKGLTSGGEKEFVKYLARAAVAVGIDALFVEVHDNPNIALCDGSNMLELNNLSSLIEQVKLIDRLVKGGLK